MNKEITITADFGWRFPPTFFQGGEVLGKTWGEEDLNDSLAILLSTRPGEHPIYPQFGCPLDEFLFEPMDQNMFNDVQYCVSRSIRLFEPRIELESVETEPEEAEGKLIIIVHYKIKSTEEEASFTYKLNLLL